jgi:hypothetical protein
MMIAFAVPVEIIPGYEMPVKIPPIKKRTIRTNTYGIQLVITTGLKISANGYRLTMKRSDPVL